MKMKIAFTGKRRKPTPIQIRRFEKQLVALIELLQEILRDIQGVRRLDDVLTDNARWRNALKRGIPK